MGVSGQCHAPAALYPKERTPLSTEQEAVWASELVGTQETRGQCRVSNPGRPVCSQALYRLSYPSSLLFSCDNGKKHLRPEILRSHGGEDVHRGLPRCDTVYV
jgi:hypothetical protein